MRGEDLNKMEWIVLKESKREYILVSKSNVKKDKFGILPKGSYLTAELENGSKAILRVVSSGQNEKYPVSHMIADLELGALAADKKSLNQVNAIVIGFTEEREDGLVNHIPPLTLCRRSTNQEINEAIESSDSGPSIFLATLQSSQSQILVDNDLSPVHVKMSNDIFFHQMIVCGKTGQGKTVALKYLAQHFVEELRINDRDLPGAVLAVNVKEKDFLEMHKASTVTNQSIEREWDILGKKAKGVSNNIVYYPSTAERRTDTDANMEPIKLDIAQIDPTALVGLISHLSPRAMDQLPDIFRWWREDYSEKPDKYQMLDFVEYFQNAEEDGRRFDTKNVIGQEIEVTVNHSTYGNMLTNLSKSTPFFDNENGSSIGASDILQSGQMSIIDAVPGRGSGKFASVLLRDLLEQILEHKRNVPSDEDIPILIIIDEVHQFYGTESSRETLETLTEICKIGRSKNIGIIFSSQLPADIPKGLVDVVNTKIFFKTNSDHVKKYGYTAIETEMLKKGYALAEIHELNQAKLVKFPLAYAGVL
jgi:DNA helicase HerA-like ATPase